MQSGTLALTNGYAQGAGATILEGGDLEVSGGAFDLLGGSLFGVQTVIGDLNNLGGNVAPGLSPGTLTVSGNYTQGPGGALSVEIGGLTAGVNHDLLVVGGDAVLDGVLNAFLVGNFSPAPADTFNIIQALGTMSGDFATINAPGSTQFNGAPNAPASGLYTIAVPGVVAPVLPDAIPDIDAPIDDATAFQDDVDSLIDTLIDLGLPVGDDEGDDDDDERAGQLVCS